MKNINKMKDRKMNICFGTDKNSYTINIELNDLIKSSLNNEKFHECINSNNKLLYSLHRENYAILKLWTALNNDDYMTIDKIKGDYCEGFLDLLIKAKNGDEFSLYFIENTISVFFILFNYFNKNVLNIVRRDRNFTLKIVEH